MTWTSSLLKKGKKFWEDGIMKLPEKWQKVVEQKGKISCSIKFLVKMKKKKFLAMNQLWKNCLSCRGGIQIRRKEIFSMNSAH